ncbi:MULTISPECIES: hypothetical protein [unclassified Roseibium]|uniref:hypothetical protein n=1 Tax=unclassified Roseibium TaxID=2629323 RepID=UPI0031727D85
MTRLQKVRVGLTGTAVLLFLSGCAVGPGTPLLAALKTEPGLVSTNVPSSQAFGPPVGAGVASGLINPHDRRATEAYLETLAPRQSPAR